MSKKVSKGGHRWTPFFWWYACCKCNEIKHMRPEDETECPEPNADKDNSCGWALPQPVPVTAYDPPSIHIN